MGNETGGQPGEGQTTPPEKTPAPPTGITPATGATSGSVSTTTPPASPAPAEPPATPAEVAPAEEGEDTSGRPELTDVAAQRAANRNTRVIETAKED